MEKGDDFISRREHEEFARRMEIENERICDENNRQNKRIEILEQNVQQISKLAANTDRLAGNMENMLKAQEQQGKRLEALEGRDGEKWRKAVSYIGTAILGAVLAIVMAKIGL